MPLADIANSPNGMSRSPIEVRPPITRPSSSASKPDEHLSGALPTCYLVSTGKNMRLIVTWDSQHILCTYKINNSSSVVTPLRTTTFPGPIGATAISTTTKRTGFSLLLAIAFSDDFSVIVWDLELDVEKWLLAKHRTSIVNMAFASPKYVVTISKQHFIHIFDMDTGHLIHYIDRSFVHSQPVLLCPTVSSIINPVAIVSDGSEGQLCAYSVATGDIIGFVSDISALYKTGTYEIVGPAGGAVRGIGALFVIVRILPPPTPPPQPQPPPQPPIEPPVGEADPKLLSPSSSCVLPQAPVAMPPIPSASEISMEFYTMPPSTARKAPLPSLQQSALDHFDYIGFMGKPKLERMAFLRKVWDHTMSSWQEQ